jgi:hypothetical protein
MLVQTLPKYTTERYYLLSEIEQLSEFVFLEEDNTFTQNKEIAVIYILWNVTNDNVEIFRTNFAKMIYNFSTKFPQIKYSLILIEAIIPNKKTIDTYDAIVSNLLNWLNNLSIVGISNFVIVGVSDHVSGSPALEKGFEFIESISKTVKLPSLINSSVFFSDNKKTYLGHNPSREPDAADDVYQVICSNSNFEEWKNNIIQLIVADNKLFDVESACHNSDNKKFHRIPIFMFIFVLIN